jgi:hypothetical protein
LLRYSADGRAETGLAELDGAEHAVHDGSSMVLPFGHRFYAAAASDRIYVGSGKPYEVSVFDRDGSMLGSIRRAHEPLPVLPADRQGLIDRALPRFTAASRASIQEELEAVELPEHFPAYDALIVDVEGNLWARDHLWPREGPATWSVFNPAGAWLGTVETPAGVAVTDIGDSMLVGYLEDESGVEHVVAYRLIKPPGFAGGPSSIR